MQEITTIISNVEITPGYHRMLLSCPGIASEARPGQFLMLKYWRGNRLFFRRPFSINSVHRSDGTLEILYKVVGEGTELMAALPAGAEVDVLGPLGNGFPLRPEMKRIAVVGRGVGAAPMRFLAEEARRMDIKVQAYISGAKEEYLFDRDLYSACGCDFNGMVGNDMNVTAFLFNDVQKMHFDAVYVCGSKRLMRDVYDMLEPDHFEAYCSLEAHMACGIGACKGCIVSAWDEDGTEHYVRVCKDGPVFPLKRMVKHD